MVSSEAPGSHFAVPGTMRTMMFSIAMTQARPAMTAKTAERRNWPIARPEDAEADDGEPDVAERAEQVTKAGRR